MNSTVCAVIVTYNPSIEILLSQYDSLVGQSDYNIYVDNGSDANGDLSNFFSSISDRPNHFIIKNKTNKGLGYAQNQGIKLALSLSVSHILLLDHDSVLYSKCLSELLGCEMSLRLLGLKVGAIGTTYVNKKSGEIYPITKYIGPFIQRRIPTNKPIEATFLIASGCLINVAVLNDVGLMNEDLFVDYIDVDWSIRARVLGYRLFATPRAKMNHQIGDVRISILGRRISLHSPIRRYYLIRNSFFMIRNKNVPLGYKLREFSFNILRFLIFFILSDDRQKYWEYTKKGIADGLNGILGPIKEG